MIEQVERMRVAWVDTDAGGRIHFTNAFRWAEVAETSLMRRLGMLERWGDYPRRHVEAEFHKVLRFEDEFDVRLRVEAVGRTSITYAWTLERDGEVYVSGRHTVVSVDREGRPEPLADDVRAALSG
ncbi:MAG: tol-pal system-associated acyl-CoA thioesterase [Gaiellaceae bacterium]|nr:MAG: tol-pal system-associated acyl-CoA thioesterase [Gaiellaceae bacterium]